MKAYTDLEQSRKLAEILPIKSADMCYIQDLLAGCKYGDYKPYIGDLIPAYGQGKIPCWSLTALLEVIRVECRMEKTPLDQSGEFTYSMVDDYNSIRTFECDNPVDACFEMILKLNEQNLL